MSTQLPGASPDDTPRPSFARTLRRIGALALPYFRSEERWRARAMLAAIVALNLAAVYMLVLNNQWFARFYDALQEKNQAVFWREIGVFCWIAAAYVAIAILKFYLTQLLQLRWRAWMTRNYLGRWMRDHTFYRLELARYAGGAAPDNPDQRIQEDMQLFTDYTMTLSMGLLNAVVTLASFIGILWGLSGTTTFSAWGREITVAGSMVWIALAYCAVGTALTHLIGRPLIGLNFRQQRYEADFRHHLVRVREYSEAIALDRGEHVEHAQLDLRFGAVLRNYLQLVRAQKNLVAFTTGFGQASVIFAFVVQAPRFFAGAIQLGQLMQVNSAFGRVQDALSWFVDNYDRVAVWRATADRLTTFEAAMRAHAGPASAVTDAPDADAEADGTEGPRAAGLDVFLPDGTVLLRDTALAVRPGDRIVLQGPSGSGKSTLLRTFAGIWPHAAGRVRLPEDAMFIPQRPYVPDGRLRDALAYPRPATDYTDAQLRQALDDALLPALRARLDDSDAWSQRLSGGEQQRLAMARVLLRKPRWLFADEATSALDAAAEDTLYRRLDAAVRAADGAIVSIAHRASVGAFHDRRWTLVPAVAGEATAVAGDAKATPRFRLETTDRAPVPAGQAPV